MKTTFRKNCITVLMLFAIFSLGFVSCSDNEDNNRFSYNKVTIVESDYITVEDGLTLFKTVVSDNSVEMFERRCEQSGFAYNPSANEDESVSDSLYVKNFVKVNTSGDSIFLRYYNRRHSYPNQNEKCRLSIRFQCENNNKLMSLFDIWKSSLVQKEYSGFVGMIHIFNNKNDNMCLDYSSFQSKLQQYNFKDIDILNCSLTLTPTNIKAYLEYSESNFTQLEFEINK